MPIRIADPFGSYLAGRAARQDEEYSATQNSLAEENLRFTKKRNALAEQQYSQEQITQALQQTAAAASRLAQSQDPRREASMYPEFVAKLREQNPQIDQMQDDELREYFGFIAGQAQSKLGIGPSAPAGPLSAQGKIGADVRGGYLTQEQGDAALNPRMTEYQRQDLDIKRQRLNQPDKPSGQFRTLTPQEIQAAGLPAGTSAQVGPDGKIDVLSKKDTSASLSQKDATTAKLKLTTIRVGRKQLEKVRQAFEEGRAGINAFGPGQGLLPTQAGKRFDAAIDQIRGTWTALKRVPGIGSMSDYESKMDAAQFPGRNDYESVIEQKLQGMEDQLALLESGYTGLLGGPQDQATAQDGVPTFATEAEAEAAGIQPGARVIIGGVPGKWQ